MIKSLPEKVERLSEDELQKLIEATLNNEVTYGRYLKNLVEKFTTFMSLIWEDKVVDNIEDLADIYQYNSEAITMENCLGRPTFQTYRLLHSADAELIAAGVVAGLESGKSTEKARKLYAAIKDLIEIAKQDTTEDSDPVSTEDAGDWDL